MEWICGFINETSLYQTHKTSQVAVIFKMDILRSASSNGKIVINNLMASSSREEETRSILSVPSKVPRENLVFVLQMLFTATAFLMIFEHPGYDKWVN